MESPDDQGSSWAPQSPDLSTYHSGDVEPIPQQHQGYRGSISHATPYSPPTSSPYAQTKSPYMPRLSVKKEESSYDADFLPDASSDPAELPSKARQIKNEGNGDADSSVLAGTEHIEVKTKFPVARIKRIMQADDDVGKVAQVTPVVVSKALELFMISLVTKAAAEAKSRSQKRVSSVHLKQAVTKDEQFDFLSEIVAKIADAPAAGDKGEGAEGEGKKRRGAGRKKKKADDDDDF